jgi:hypothetical protein
MKECGHLDDLHELQNEVATHGTKKELCLNVATWLISFEEKAAYDEQLHSFIDEFIQFCQSNGFHPGLEKPGGRAETVETHEHHYTGKINNAKDITYGDGHNS